MLIIKGTEHPEEFTKPNMLLTNEEICAAGNADYTEKGLRECRAIAEAQVKAVAEWGNEPCPFTTDIRPRLKRECPDCWQSLLKEVG